MRVVFIVLGWFFAIVAALRGIAAVYTAWLITFNDAVGWDITVKDLITEHLQIFNWTIRVGEALFPADFLAWILGLPALPVFATSALVAALLAFLFFRLGRKRA